jgi:hypothetical protein
MNGSANFNVTPIYYVKSENFMETKLIITPVSQLIKNDHHSHDPFCPHYQDLMQLWIKIPPCIHQPITYD